MSVVFFFVSLCQKTTLAVCLAVAYWRSDFGSERFNVYLKGYVFHSLPRLCAGSAVRVCESLTARSGVPTVQLATPGGIVSAAFQVTVAIPHFAAIDAHLSMVRPLEKNSESCWIKKNFFLVKWAKGNNKVGKWKSCHQEREIEHF
jgi:hypothetical protein